MLATRHKIALAAMAYRVLTGLRRLMGLPTNVEVVRRGIRWQLDLNEGIDFSIYLLGAFEHSTLRTYQRFVAPGSTVFDIGANIGAHTLHLAHCVGDAGRVIAFEPTAYAYRKLLQNLALNPALSTRVEAAQILLDESEQPAPPTLYSSWPLTHGGPARHPKHLGRPMETAGAAVTTLDAYLDAHPGLAPNFIKLDVDGNECRVLRGARASLRRYQPTLLVELMPYGLEEAGCSFEEMLSLLEGPGYRLFRIPGLAPLPAAASQLRRRIPEGGSINVIAAPQAPDAARANWSAGRYGFLD